jgi:putative phage-type endonuclease
MKVIKAEKHDRQNSIGGSDASAVLGLNPWRTPMEVWTEKTKGREDFDNEAMLWGRTLEDVVAREFARRNNVAVSQTNMVFYHDKYPLSASLDRFVHAPDKKPYYKGEIKTEELLEVKTARSGQGWGDSGTDVIPVYYLPQCYQYLGITGCKRIHVAVLIGGSDYRQYVIERDDDLIDQMFSKLNNWWEQFVIKECPPPPRTEEDVKALYPKGDGSKVVAPAEIEKMVRKESVIKEQIKKLEDEDKALKKSILESMGEATELVAPNGDLLATWRSTKDRESTNWKALAEDCLKTKSNAPEIIKNFTEMKAGYRTFLNKTKGEE